MLIFLDDQAGNRGSEIGDINVSGLGISHQFLADALQGTFEEQLGRVKEIFRFQAKKFDNSICGDVRCFSACKAGRDTVACNNAAKVFIAVSETDILASIVVVQRGGCLCGVNFHG
jgi:hypothetical protein